MYLNNIAFILIHNKQHREKYKREENLIIFENVASVNHNI